MDVKAKLIIPLLSKRNEEAGSINERETVYNVLFVQFEFLPVEQAETDLKKVKVCNTVYLHGKVCVLNSVR